MQEERLYELLNRERVNKIQSLISAGKLDVNNVNMKDKEGNTALHEAVIKREPVEIIKLLIQAGADVKLENNDGYTAIQLFLELHVGGRIKDYNNILKVFLKAGADLNSQSFNGDMTPLHIAARDSDLASVKYFLSRGADPRIRSASARTPLQFAVFSGDLAVIETLLTADSELLNVADEFGHTPLHTLVDENTFNGKLKDIIKCLELFKNFNVDMHVKDRNGFKPVDLAIKKGVKKEFDALEAFLQLGLIDIEGRCNIYGERRPDQCTILFAACKRNSLPLAKYLLKKGANINAVDDEGMSVLHYVFYESRGELEYLNLLEYLFKWRPSLDTTDLNGYSFMNEVTLLAEENPEHPALLSVIRYVVKYSLSDLELLNISKILRAYFKGLDEFRDLETVGIYLSDCSREIERMYGDAIPLRDRTFWHLLTGFKGDMLFYLKNLNVVKFLKDIDISNRYPIYGPEIQKKVDKTLEKLEVYKKSAEVLSSCLPPHYNLGDLVVVNKIVSYCKTKELRLLCE